MYEITPNNWTFDLCNQNFIYLLFSTVWSMAILRRYILLAFASFLFSSSSICFNGNLFWSARMFSFSFMLHSVNVLFCWKYASYLYEQNIDLSRLLFSAGFLLNIFRISDTKKKGGFGGLGVLLRMKVAFSISAFLFVTFVRKYLAILCLLSKIIILRFSWNY